MSDLEGATSLGEPWAHAADAGEFAARWNALSPEDRENAHRALQRSMGEATACFVENHRRRLALLGGAEVQVVVRVSNQVTLTFPGGWAAAKTLGAGDSLSLRLRADGALDAVVVEYADVRSPAREPEGD